MEQETMLKEILNALKIHSDHMDQKFKKADERFEQVDKRFDNIDDRLDRIEKKKDGFRVGLTESQETIDFISVKTLQHEKKLRKINQS
ncbi:MULTISPECIES: hypothetical protein [Metabacillus]|uniref:t-SNARE coiled-coil homology domain-containing protein n=2 Tax=Metabacillus TaxID=2675233 RepID=A0A179SXI6_9BACI|nr:MULTISPECIES: hypothetical protein [Metabacillus]OAS85820.1 hypothetical protein A6K24_23515 [Metabacillus litoralis]QNF27192.1 hypothetical protein HUW50_06495 [Metabacillus sp. KUDC1714]